MNLTNTQTTTIKNKRKLETFGNHLPFTTQQSHCFFNFSQMRASKNPKINQKKINSPSLRILHPQEVIEKMSFSEYDEQPTIIFLASNRDSLNSASYRQSSKGHQLKKRSSRVVTYESNLMESSPQRSDSSAVDGEFVCKYLTPIKKQQFEQLLFKDQINENYQNLRTKPTKPLRQERKPKFFKPNTQQDLKIRSITNEKQKNIMYSNMIKSFLPCGSIHQADQNTQSQVKEKNSSTSKLQEIPSANKIISTPSIFIDPNAQVHFLKLNNNQLFKKLQAEIEKNHILEQKNYQFSNQNKILIEKIYEQQNLIDHLKQTIIKLQQEKRKYLAQEWEEFQLVKNLLIEKRKSKSKEKSNQKQIPKSTAFNSKINLLQKIQKGVFDSKKQEYVKITSPEERQSILRQNGESFGRVFTSSKMSLSHNCQTIQSENQKNSNKMNRKMSYESISQSRRHSTKVRDKSQVARILQDKLLINEQNQCKKSVQSSPSKKGYRKTSGSGPKQNNESGSKLRRRF